MAKIFRVGDCNLVIIRHKDGGRRKENKKS